LSNVPTSNTISSPLLPSGEVEEAHLVLYIFFMPAGCPIFLLINLDHLFAETYNHLAISLTPLEPWRWFLPKETPTTKCVLLPTRCFPFIQS
jgi:hypothetical protein